MPSILWRILAACLIAWAVFALIGPVSRVIGLPISSDGLTIVKIVAAVGLAWYILFGSWWPTKPAA